MKDDPFYDWDDKVDESKPLPVETEEEWEPNQSKMPRFSIRYEGGKPVLSAKAVEKPFNPDDFTAKGVR